MFLRLSALTCRAKKGPHSGCSCVQLGTGVPNASVHQPCGCCPMQAPEEVINALIRDADIDGDGQISFDEFVRLMTVEVA